MPLKNIKLRFKDLFVGRIRDAAEPGSVVIKCKVRRRYEHWVNNMTLACYKSQQDNVRGTAFGIKDILSRPFDKSVLSRIPIGTRYVYMSYDPKPVKAFMLESFEQRVIDTNDLGDCVIWAATESESVTNVKFGGTSWI